MLSFLNRFNKNIDFLFIDIKDILNISNAIVMTEETKNLNEIKELSEKMTFECGYVLWYHSVVEKSWSKESYINLCEDIPGKVIKNAVQLWGVFNALGYNFTAGMFFIMKEGILPMWEDPGNANGGFWSFKVPKRNSNDVWKKLTAGLVGNSLTVNSKNISSITGISISPKISNCVMKIWNNTSNVTDLYMFTKEIDYLDPASIRYTKNK
jgi:hypothetical protein